MRKNQVKQKKFSLRESLTTPLPFMGAAMLNTLKPADKTTANISVYTFLNDISCSCMIIQNNIVSEGFIVLKTREGLLP